MAQRGRKNKPVSLKLVTGNPGNRPIEDDFAVDADLAHDNGLEAPKKLLKREQELWDQFVRPAHWLTHFDAPKAFMWVKLQVQFEKKPADFAASMIAQLRALGSELGLDPSTRSRMAGSSDDKKKDDPAAKYF